MKRIVLVLGVALSIVLCASCSSTNSNVRVQAEQVSVSGVSIAIIGDVIQTSSQGNGRIFTLHHSAQEILAIARNVAALYGFVVVDPVSADYIIDFNQAVSDGGACIEGTDSVELDLSYSISVLTFGAFPATGVHCMVVTAELSANFSDEPQLMGEFVSNKGIVEVYAGANEIVNYKRTVQRKDEARGLEFSIGALLTEMINEGAFEP